MARHHKRKREESHRHHSLGRRSSSSMDVGVDETSSRTKRLRLTPEPTDSPTLRSPRADTEDGPGDQGELPINDDDGWQIVGPKSRENKRRGPDNEKVKYPELVFRGKNSVPIRIADLQNLVLYTLADGIAPNWVAFKYARHTRKVVVLMVPGFERGMFDGAIDLTGAQADSTSMAANGSNSQVQRRPSRTNSHFELWKQGKPEREP